MTPTNKPATENMIEKPLLNRYDVTEDFVCGSWRGEMEESQNGDYVLFSDIAALVEESEVLKKQKDALVEALKECKTQLYRHRKDDQGFPDGSVKLALEEAEAALKLAEGK